MREEIKNAGMISVFISLAIGIWLLICAFVQYFIIGVLIIATVGIVLNIYDWIKSRTR